MVIEDLTRPSILPRVHSEELRLASVSDRAFAFFLDVIIISPIISLFFAGLVKQIKTLLMINSNTSETIGYWLFLIAIVFITSFLIQAIFIYHWQATPGQRFMHLKVISWPHRQQEMSFSKALTRSFLWCFSWILLAVPFMEILGHPFRRAFHERASDTLVVTLKDKDEGPIYFETRFIASWMNMFFIGVVLAVIFLGFGAWNSFQQSLKVSDIAQDQNETVLCDEVSKYMNEFTGKNITPYSRIDTSIAFLLSDKSQHSCLNKEANSILWKNNFSGEEKAKSISWAYLAKAISETDRKLKLKYLNQTCEELAVGEACEISLLLDEKPNNFDKLKKKSFKSLTGKVLLIEDAIKENNYIYAISKIKEISDVSILSKYSNKRYIGAVWLANVKAQNLDQVPEQNFSKQREPASKSTKPIIKSAESKQLEQVLRDFRRDFDIQ